MAPLIEIFGFLSVLLRGAILAFQSLVIGGLVFYLGTARVPDFSDAQNGIRRLVLWFAAALAITDTLFILANSAILMESAEIPFDEVTGANYFIAGSISVMSAIVIWALARRDRLRTVPVRRARPESARRAVRAAHSWPRRRPDRALPPRPAPR